MTRLILAFAIAAGGLYLTSHAGPVSSPVPAQRGAPDAARTPLSASRSGATTASQLPTAAPRSAIGSALVSGKATWYCGFGAACTRGYDPGDLLAAIDPKLGISRGTLVTVRHGNRAVLVRIVDVCACGGARVIDLTSGAFMKLAPRQTPKARRAFLARGVIQVELEVGGALPPTDMAP